MRWRCLQLLPQGARFLLAFPASRVMNRHARLVKILMLRWCSASTIHRDARGNGPRGAYRDGSPLPTEIVEGCPCPGDFALDDNAPDTRPRLGVANALRTESAWTGTHSSPTVPIVQRRRSDSDCAAEGPAAECRRKRGSPGTLHRTWYHGHAAPTFVNRVPRDLGHPFLSGAFRHSCQGHAPALQLQNEEQVIGHQSSPAEHFDSQEIDADENGHMRTNEVRPSRVLAAFRSRCDPESAKDVAHGWSEIS